MRILLLAAFLFCTCKVSAQLTPFFSTESNKYGYKNSHGQIVVWPKYDLAWNFTEGLSPMRLNGKYGFINDQGIVVVTPKYDHAAAFSDGLSVVKMKDKCGFIDKTGRVVIPLVYDRADNFHVDRANVCQNGKWSVLIYP